MSERVVLFANIIHVKCTTAGKVHIDLHLCYRGFQGCWKRTYRSAFVLQRVSGMLEKNI